MTDEELDDIERRAKVAGNIRPQRALALVAEVRRLRALTVDDPTSIYHEHEQLRQALEAIALGRCDGHLHHPTGSPPCPYRTPTAYARAVLAERAGERRD